MNAIPGMHTARPDATFYLFVNVTEAMAAKGFTDVANFASAARVAAADANATPDPIVPRP